jgi:hypothetical protein
MVASVFCWSMWLCRNEFVFEKKILQLLYKFSQLAPYMDYFHKATSQDLVEACQHLGQVVKELFITRAHE